MRFESLYAHGSAGSRPQADVYIADPARNAESVVDVSRRLSESGVAVACSPSSPDGYAVSRPARQDVLLDAVHEGLAAIARETADMPR